MLGWEYPPFNSGGLGVACHWLAKHLSKKNDIILVLPKRLDIKFPFGKLIFAQDYLPNSFLRFDIDPYNTKMSTNFISWQDSSLYEQTMLFTEAVKKIVSQFEFDIIHAHDWLTYLAGIEAKKISQKPLLVHVHATEFDRSGGNFVNSHIYEIEKNGFEFADKIIVVSNFTKNKIITHYNADRNKISVVYNGIESGKKKQNFDDTFKKILGKKLVIFVGRFTLQKGPDYFVKAAKKVLDYYKDVIFVMAGAGEMQNFLIEETVKLNIADKIIFSGFLRDNELEKLYQNADLFVMPSVSEPFGIASLEAMINKTPILISKQSGVSEVVNHALKVDFWDVDEMANKILAILNYKPLEKSLKENGYAEVNKITWQKAADAINNIYLEFAPAYV